MNPLSLLRPSVSPPLGHLCQWFQSNKPQRPDRNPSAIFDARDAYLAALDRDNLQDYENFLIA